MFLENSIIGQASAKNKLEIFANSYKRNGQLPFLLITGAKGEGKTKLTREFQKELKRPNSDETPRLIEVNAASIKNTNEFFSSIYPKWREEKATLFIDEVHNLNAKLSELFLTVLEKDPNPVRRITVPASSDMPEQEHLFDFREMSIIMATTDQQKLKDPLKDRLTMISLASYDDDELYAIFMKNVKSDIEHCLKDEIISLFRGNPRSCVSLAELVDHYAASKGKTSISEKDFQNFRQIMGVHDHGLNEAELKIIKVLGNRPHSLNQLAGVTGYSKSVIQQDYEKYLMRLGFLDINVKRSLTGKGTEFFLKKFVAK